MRAQTRLNVLNFDLAANLEVAQIDVLALVVNLVGGMIHLLNDDEVRVEHHSVRHLEEVLLALHSHVGQRLAATVRDLEGGCGLGGTVHEEFHVFWGVFVRPVEWLAILWLQGHVEIRLVHSIVGLAKVNVTLGLIADNVLW